MTGWRERITPATIRKMRGAVNRLGVRVQEDIEDIVQETLLDALLYTRGEPSGDIDTLMCWKARQGVYRHWRYNKRHPEHSNREPFPEGWDAPIPPDQEDHVALHEALNRINRTQTGRALIAYETQVDAPRVNARGETLRARGIEECKP